MKHTPDASEEDRIRRIVAGLVALEFAVCPTELLNSGSVRGVGRSSVSTPLQVYRMVAFEAHWGTKSAAAACLGLNQNAVRFGVIESLERKCLADTALAASIKSIRASVDRALADVFGTESAPPAPDDIGSTMRSGGTFDATAAAAVLGCSPKAATQALMAALRKLRVGLETLPGSDTADGRRDLVEALFCALSYRSLAVSLSDIAEGAGVDPKTVATAFWKIHQP